MNDAAPSGCPVCGGECVIHDVVDFNKSCEESKGKFVELSGRPIYYHLCQQCHFCFAPEMHEWSLDKFTKEIYNDDYGRFDPDYEGLRPKGNAEGLMTLFGRRAPDIRHLDYGGGNGLLSRILCDHGFKSQSYDPFVNRDVNIEALGEFDLITAYEVFEHVPDVQALMTSLTALRKANGVVLFSTLVSDGEIVQNQRLTWWYASPRNGHISLFSRDSLVRLSSRFALKFGSFNSGLHAFWTAPPDWAGHVFK